VKTKTVKVRAMRLGTWLSENILRPEGQKRLRPDKPVTSFPKLKNKIFGTGMHVL